VKGSDKVGFMKILYALQFIIIAAIESYITYLAFDGISFEGGKTIMDIQAWVYIVVGLVVAIAAIVIPVFINRIGNNILDHLGSDKDKGILFNQAKENYERIETALRTERNGNIMKALGIQDASGTNLTGQHNNILAEIGRLNSRAEDADEWSALLAADIREVTGAIEKLNALFKERLEREHIENIHLRNRIYELENLPQKE
jgi:hypothetical protein